MRLVRSLLTQTAVAFALILFFSLMAAGQQAAIVPARITQPVDLENLVTLQGNTHPLARPEFDQGAAPDSQPMERILLVSQRSPEQETALRKLLDEQQIKSSPNYHMWLTPEQFGQQFGPADADIQAVTDWLTSQGFQVIQVAAGRTVIEFSGTAGAVRQAFHTEIHKFVVNGEEHWANASDPQIPAALAPVVAGFASLNNFPRRPRIHRLGTFSRSKATGLVRPLFTFPYEGGYVPAVGPADFATIYNLSPLYSAGIDGTGQIIAIVAETDINIQDVQDFRTMFNVLPLNNLPNIILNGPDPGILAATGDETESDVDVQWSGAVAKGATVDLVVSETTEVTGGVDLSALYIIDNNFAPIMSESYGACEAYLGSGGNAFYSTLWEQGAAQGITILEAQGDTGSAGCDDFGPSYEVAAQFGLAADGNASTPFDVAVGGTDFNVNNSNWQQYWNYSANSSVYPSAKSYIPEMTWNDSCANTGVAGDCTAARISSDQASYPGVDLAAGGGGPSNCASSIGTFPNVICTAAYAKPAWQSGTGVPNDSVRDTPDVSLFAGDGFVSGSFYVFCEMDANASSGGSSSSCDLNAPYLDFQGVGGTSVATQAFAGIMALVNQKTGERQGNANYVLYPLAAQAGASCNSSALPANSSSCIFYDVTTGNNSVACVGGSPNCSNTNTASGNYGILEVNPPSNSTPAWTTGTGYDLPTGLGSVNAANLVNKWTSVSFAPTTTTLSLSPTTVTHGAAVNVTVNVIPASATGDVSLIGGPNNSNLGIDFGTLGSGTLSGATSMLPGGTYNVTAHYAGNGTYGASNSSPVQVTVNPEGSQTLVHVGAYTPDCSGNFTYGTTIPYGYSVLCSGSVYPYWLRLDVTNSTGSVCFLSSGFPAYQCPNGQVTVTNNGGAITDLGAPAKSTPGTYALNNQGNAEDQFIQLPGGTDNLVASYTPSPAPPNNSYTSSQGAATITVTQAATTVIVSASPMSVPSGSNVTLTALLTTASVGFAPSGTVQFLNAGTAIPGTVTYAPVNGSTSGNASLCLSPLAPATACASLTATLTTSFTANASITAQYSGDTNYAGSSTSTPLIVTVTGAPNFSLLASPSAITISAGKPGSSTITLTPTGGFTGPVNFTCAVPAGMTGAGCSLSPTSLTTSGTTTLTVTTAAPALVVPRAPELTLPPSLHLRFGLPWLLAGLLALAMLISLIATRRRPVTLAFATTLLVIGVWVACGGGGGGGGTSPPAAPAVSISPTTLTFASQNVGTTSAAQSVTLSNTGNATLSITSIAIGGTNAGDFAQTNTCGSSVAAGANCAISVTFTPTAAGTRSASLAITDNASGSPQAVSLSGTGVAVTPVVSLSPTALTFASQNVGTTSAAQSVTLSNTGNATLSVSSIAITGTNAGDFAQTNTCGSSVAAGANCAISVTFTPTAAGTRSASLAITDNASGSPQTVSLSGTGVAVTPVVSLSPTALTFASQNVGTTSAAQSVTLSNTGNATLSVSSIAITGTNAGDFAQTNTCNGSVAAGANCAISVTFTPTATGARSASLAITDNASGSPQTVSLSGTGGSAGTPPGSYTVTVTATSGGLSQTVNIQVTVQ